MAENLSFDRWLKRCALILLVVFGASLPACEGCPAQPPDTLDLQLEWSYPLAIVDMKLVDFDGDGIKEILVGFNSDSARVGILSAVTQSMVWQSPGLHGCVLTVAAGDRNADGFLDIAGGGKWPDSAFGYVQVFDGPDFETVHSLLGFDECVTSVVISSVRVDSLPKILVGTSWDTTYLSGEVDTMEVHEHLGNLHILNGSDLSVEKVTRQARTVDISLFDADGDGCKEVFFGADYERFLCDPHVPFCSCVASTGARELAQDSLQHFHLEGEGAHEHCVATFGALEVGRGSSGDTTFVFACGDVDTELHDNCTEFALRCWNERTGELQWWWRDVACWPLSANVYTGLQICAFGGEPTPAVCAVRHGGPLEFRDFYDGTVLALAGLTHNVKKLALGNVDPDSLTEICLSSSTDIHVYEESSVFTQVGNTEEAPRPLDFFLFQNYPNPFNPETSIRFTLPFSSEVTLSVHNILGQQVRTIVRLCQAGTNTVIWDGRNSSGEDVASGVYLYRLSAGQYQDTKKMLMIR